MRQLFNRLVPFIIAGITLVALAFGLVLLAYLFIFGAIVGMTLFLINWARNIIRQKRKSVPASNNKQGRVIDTNDWRKL